MDLLMDLLTKLLMGKGKEEGKVRKELQNK